MKNQLKQFNAQLEGTRTSTPLSLVGLSTPNGNSNSNKSTSDQVGTEVKKSEAAKLEIIKSLEFGKGAKGGNNSTFEFANSANLTSSSFFSQGKLNKSEQVKQQIGQNSNTFAEPQSRTYKLRLSVNINSSKRLNHTQFPVSPDSGLIFNSIKKSNNNTQSSQGAYNSPILTKSFNSTGNLFSQGPNNQGLRMQTSNSIKNLNDQQDEDDREMYITQTKLLSPFYSQKEKFTFNKPQLNLERVQTHPADFQDDKKYFDGLCVMSPIPRSRKDIRVKPPQQIEQVPQFSTFRYLDQNGSSSKQFQYTPKNAFGKFQTSSYLFDAFSTEQEQESDQVASANLKSFSEDYKKINQIVQEATHFNDPMGIQESMLTSTMTKNILPRKLGIIQGANMSKRTLSEAIKKRKMKQLISNGQGLNSFTSIQSPDINSPISNFKEPSRSESGGLLAKYLSPKKANFLKGMAGSPDYQKYIIPGTLQQKKSPTLIQNMSTSQLGNFYPYSIMKRSNSSQSPMAQKKTPRTPNSFADGNNLSEFEMKRQFDRVSFKNSNEVATYLKKNYTSKDEGPNGIGDDTSFYLQKFNLNLQRLQISSTYAEMLAGALQHSDFENLNSLNLLDNNLTGNAIHILAGSLPANLRKLYLCQNYLNSNDANALINLFNCKKYSSLMYLNLSNNQIGDLGLKKISQQLSINDKLLILNLNHNKLTDQSMPLLRDILYRNSSLQELYLSWNLISSKGGIEIAAGLANSFVIKVNSFKKRNFDEEQYFIDSLQIGQNPQLQSGAQIIESCTKIESGVIHLDLSYNLFSAPECVKIASALEKNKKLFGFHFEGNQSNAIVDSRGYIFFPSESQILQKHVSTHSIMKREIVSVKCRSFNKMQNFNCNVTDNCWICDGWQEIEFAINQGSSDVFVGEPAFLHLDFEDFRPTNMEKDPTNPNRFVLRRMCPPNRRIHFFFTNPCIKILFYSSEYDKIRFHLSDNKVGIYQESIYDEESEQEKQNENPPSALPSQKLIPAPNELFKTAHYFQHSKQRKFNVKYMDGTVQEYIVPTTVNYVQTQLHQNISRKKGEYEIFIKCLPRQEETFFQINFTNQWQRDISVFRDFAADTPEIENKCFQEDWESSKIQSVLANSDKGAIDIAECKKIILEKFPQIRVLYRYLSCFGVLNDVFCVTIHPFSLFASQSKIVDGTLLKMTDMQCLFVAASTKALKTKNMRTPEKALTRNEFLELIGRLAVDKYIRNKLAKTSGEALSLLFNEPTFVNHIKEYEDPQKWRNVRYWTEQCDQMMKRYLNFLKSLWNEFADSRKMEKRGVNLSTKTMGLQEFQDMVNEFELKDKNLTEREVIMSFNFSLQTIIDEITSDKYMQMSFVEFLEGIARLAEFKSVTPVGERKEAYYPGESLQISLEYKIESLLEQMIDIFHNVIKERKSRQFLMMKQLQKGNSRIGGLKNKKQFIQFSLQEIDEQEKSEKTADTSNKFVSFVQKLMTNIKKKGNKLTINTQLNNNSSQSLQAIAQEENEENQNEQLNNNNSNNNELQMKEPPVLKSPMKPTKYIRSQNQLSVTEISE